jgi:hypothetical protein
MMTKEATAMASDPLKHHYACLTPAERFALTIEAMARGDENEADRLEDSCPRLTYSHADAKFQDRLRRSYTIALLAMVNLQKLLAVIRCSRTMGGALSPGEGGASGVGAPAPSVVGPAMISVKSNTPETTGMRESIKGS